MSKKGNSSYPGKFDQGKFKFAWVGEKFQLAGFYCTFPESAKPVALELHNFHFYNQNSTFKFNKPEIAINVSRITWNASTYVAVIAISCILINRFPFHFQITTGCLSSWFATTICCTSFSLNGFRSTVSLHSMPTDWFLNFWSDLSKRKIGHVFPKYVATTKYWSSPILNGDQFRAFITLNVWYSLKLKQGQDIRIDVSW